MCVKQIYIMHRRLDDTRHPIENYVHCGEFENQQNFNLHNNGLLHAASTNKHPISTTSTESGTFRIHDNILLKYSSLITLRIIMWQKFVCEQNSLYAETRCINLILYLAYSPPSYHSNNLKLFNF